MAALTKKAGVTLQTGATESPVSNTYTQSDTKSAAGELRIIRDEEGNDISAYVADPHTEFTFEAILAASVTDKEIGDTVSMNSKSYLVTQWTVTETNEDIKKVTIGLRSTDITSSSSGGGSGGGAVS